MKALGVLALILFIVALIVFGPLLTIWAFNTLFPTLEIPYTWRTWAATLVAVAAVRGYNFRKGKE